MLVAFWGVWGALAQQPAPLPADPLPADPLKPGGATELILLPDELPMLPQTVEKPEPLPHFTLKLALDAMQPVLPPLDPGVAQQPFASSVRVLVKRFEFTGNHQFSSRQLGAVVARYSGREIDSDELEAARVALTKHYVDAGFISSGAVLPDQDLKDGVVKFHLVEGRLAEIDVNGNFWFRRWWLRHQIRRAAGWPLNVFGLKTGLQLMRQNPGIRQVNAELSPGVRPGESILHVAVEEKQPFRLGFEISNQRPPSVAEGLGAFYLQNLNLTGHDDPIELRWGLVEWTKDGAIDYAGFDNVEGSYEFPISPWGTKFGVRAAKSDSSIIDETFAALGITSKSQQLELALRQPLHETLQNTVTLSLVADRKHSESFLLGIPFTLSAGAIQGESDVFATRAVLEWVNRSQLYVLALRSTISVGSYNFGATRYDPRSFTGTTSGAGVMGADPEVPDSKFFTWLGQGQYVRRIFDTAIPRTEPDKGAMRLLRESLLVLRANVQLSDEPLLALEQFSLGGAHSVRGYRENQLLRDNGWFASAELRVPVWLAADKSPIVSVAPFFDYGAGWNVNKFENQYQDIYSAGVGLLINATKHSQVSVYWGHPFIDLHNPRTSLQDDGWHIVVSFNAF
ncbi:MAG: ShlB/FhaC/HecB family hemolysin secretion/activation protein [Chthoniobacteraceae bacterium]